MEFYLIIIVVLALCAVRLLFLQRSLKINKASLYLNLLAADFNPEEANQCAGLLTPWRQKAFGAMTQRVLSQQFDGCREELVFQARLEGFAG